MVNELLPLKFDERRQPIVVSYGMGRDSTAVLVGLHQRGIRPDLILFADVGAERAPTYGFLPIINAWLRSVGFPEVTVVRYEPVDFKHWPPYHTIEENILTNVALPSIAYGGHSCSSKWKISAQNRMLRAWPLAREAWGCGLKVRKAIGFEDSPHEHRRAERGCATFAVQDDEKDLFELWYPLQEWHWNLERCIEEIKKAGLPVPPKSSCYFCTAMKPWEVTELATIDPEKLCRIVIIEARTSLRHINYVVEKRARLQHDLAGELTAAERSGKQASLDRLPPDGTPLTEGIWRRRVKGCRGATPHPGSMTEFIREQKLLPAPLIDALIAATPKHHFTAENFAKLGIRGWQDWIRMIISDASRAAGPGEKAA